MGGSIYRRKCLRSVSQSAGVSRSTDAFVRRGSSISQRQTRNNSRPDDDANETTDYGSAEVMRTFFSPFLGRLSAS